MPKSSEVQKVGEDTHAVLLLTKHISMFIPRRSSTSGVPNELSTLSRRFYGHFRISFLALLSYARLNMAQLEKEIRTFIESYAPLFASPDACSMDRVTALCEKIGPHYRPGMTMFTNGKVSRFKVCLPPSCELDEHIDPPTEPVRSRTPNRNRNAEQHLDRPRHETRPRGS